jgi:hypothetical protein
MKGTLQPLPDDFSVFAQRKTRFHRPSLSHSTAKSTAVDPKPSSNHADKLAARVVTRGFPW